VVQLRTLDLLAENLPKMVSHVLQEFRVELENGALIVIEPSRTRVRILPL
jgi:predicted nuclease of predicted toxin-antitoxin system